MSLDLLEKLIDKVLAYKPRTKASKLKEQQIPKEPTKIKEKYAKTAPI